MRRWQARGVAQGDLQPDHSAWEGNGADVEALPKQTLSKALVEAHRWRRRIESGQAKSITDLAEQEGVTDAYVCRLLPLTCLAPEIVEAILDGRQPKGLRLAELLGNGSLGWEDQRAGWGFSWAAARYDPRSVRSALPWGRVRAMMAHLWSS